MAKPKSKDIDGLSMVNPGAAAIDISSTMHMAAINPDTDDKPVRAFGTFTGDLHDMARWFKECGVTSVAMESTGVYWIPAYEILEGHGFRVTLINARYAKNVPGRKTDVSDATWLQRLHSYGLLRGSFRPEAEVATLRAYLRQRERLIEYAASHIQHMQKALMEMNVQLHHVVSDITGVTGMRIIRAIVAGERKPGVLADMRDIRCHASAETICAALSGNWRDEHIFVLCQSLALYDFYQTNIVECDRKLEIALQNLAVEQGHDIENLPKVRTKTKQPNTPDFEVRSALYLVLGVDLTQIHGIKPVRTRKHKPVLSDVEGVTTDSNHRLGVAANWLDGYFAADVPNRKWAGDITYICTAQGWLYLAVILDLHSRRVVGWAVSDRMKKDLAIRALDMAVRLRQPPEGCLFHSDRSSQYCSYDYQKKLQAYGLRPSMSGKGNCYDNASVETFFKSLKVQLIWRQSWPTRRQAEAAIFQYINDGMDAPRLIFVWNGLPLGQSGIRRREGNMTEIASIGLDIAKTWFQVHAADRDGKPVLRRKIRRDQVLQFFGSIPPCLIGIEACSTSHHWARAIESTGHQVRLIPPQYVKPFVKRSKTDSADAEAICEALKRAGIRYVPIKTREQQASLALHRARDLLVRQRTMLTNMIRGTAAEFGIVVPTGSQRVGDLREALQSAELNVLPDDARGTVQLLFAQLDDLGQRIETLEQRILAWHRANDVSRRLASIPGIGPMNATLLAATVPDASQFKSGREFAAWIGLVPREHSSGGKQRLGGISKRGNPYMRRLLIVGAHAVLRWTRRGKGMQNDWLLGLIERKPANVVAVAIANKLARIAWAIMARGGVYQSANIAIA